MGIRKIFQQKQDMVQRLREQQNKTVEISARQAELQRERELNEGVPYVVRQGDNLTKISQATGISIYDLVNDNGIKDKNVINAGDTIFFQHHHKPEDAINSESMNEDFPNMADQGYYLDAVEDAALERFHNVSEKGVQEYLKNKDK